MMLQVKKYMKFLLAALLVFGSCKAFAWEPCGTNLQYEIDGTTPISGGDSQTKAW